MTTYRFQVNDALQRLPGPLGERFVPVFAHGTLSIELYAPRRYDPQSPHQQDEIYVIVQGQDQFYYNGERHAFEPGDLLFVPAGSEHRFEDFNDDLLVWVIFYGPRGRGFF